jgi:hypothetical protein
MRKRKALKGGYLKGKETTTGPALNKNLDKIPDDEIKNIKSTYETNLQESEKDIKLRLAIKNQAALEYAKDKDNKTKEAVVETKIEANRTRSAAVTYSNIKYVSSGLFKFFENIIGYITNFVSSAVYNAFHGGQGVIIKAIFAIFVIVSIILGATNIIHGFNSNSSKLPKYNDIGQSILFSDNEKYLVMPNSNSFLARMSNGINDLIPNQYKYKWASISNSVTYITSGKNQYDNYLTDREETDEGRCDNIFHINFTNGSVALPKEKTFSIIKPKPVILEFNKDLYHDSDYNKIDSNINELVGKYHNKCVIPINPNQYGKYALDLKQTSYYNENGLIDDVNKTKFIKNIFNDNKDLKLNSFSNLLYTGYFDINNVIASYSTKLINPNYKGPILRLTTTSILKNQFDKTQKTANFFNRYKTNYLYCLVQNKEVSFKDFFKDFINKNASIYVSTIYDQSGNEHHFAYEDHDNKYMPEYIEHNYNKLIKFSTRTILYLNKPIVHNDIKLITKIKSIKTEIISQSEIDKAKSDLDEAKKLFDEAKTQYYYIKIKYDNAKKDYDTILKVKKIYDAAPPEQQQYILSKDEVRNYNNELNKIKNNYNINNNDYNIKLNNYNIKENDYKLKETIYNNLKYNQIDGYMDFLATRTSSVVALYPTSDFNRYNFLYTGNPVQNSFQYPFLNNIDEMKVMTSEFENIEFILNTPENSGNNITFECLGNVYDPRTSDEKNKDSNGNILGEKVHKHSYRGYLSELRIFKNS